MQSFGYTTANPGTQTALKNSLSHAKRDKY